MVWWKKMESEGWKGKPVGKAECEDTLKNEKRGQQSKQGFLKINEGKAL
jgi:hypothetical protein